MHRLNFFTRLIFISSLTISVNPSLSYSQNENLTEQIAKQPPETKYVVADFSNVAKKAVPAVVSIQVQGKKRGGNLGKFSGSDENFEFFSKDDLYELFGIPKKDSSHSQPSMGQASGVVVSQDGYILTNSHVVHDMENITVLMNDGRELPAKLLGDDPNTDLAIVKIEATNLPYLTLGNSDDLEVGQWVAAVGNPLGMQATMTAGIVSAKNRNNLDIARYEDFIQTDAAINRGNSGGPLITLNGEVIGINTAIATNATAGYMGIGFAIPSNVAKHVMSEILSDGKVSHGFLGVTLQSIDYNLARAFDLKKVGGALITSVLKNSPAEKGGLKVEDIVLKIDDKEVSSAASLRNLVYMQKPGTKIKLSVMRDDKNIDLSVTISDQSQDLVASNAQKTDWGIEVDSLTPELARTLGYTKESGVVVTKVDPSSSAALAGIKKGALILSVNRVKVSSLEEFNQAVAKTLPDRPLLLQVKQGNYNIFLSITNN